MKMGKAKTPLSPTIKTNVIVDNEDDKVVLVFGQPIAWLEMEPVVAIKIAELIKEKAIEILRSVPKP